MIKVFDDEYYMKQAFLEAEKAYEEGEIPIGAIIVCNDRIVARAHNSTEKLTDVTAHAEILAITSASNYLGSKYLKDCTLYVTIEPCVMCAGALKWAQIGKIIFSASDEKAGFFQFGKGLLHPKTKIEMGILEEESKNIMKRFFTDKR